MRVLGTALSFGMASGIYHQVNQETLATSMVTSVEMKRACGKKIHKKFSWLQNPGAGMDPDAVKPFDKVLKDGYLLVACVKDAMYVHGDKFGNNKYDYKMGPTANSSIVHYNEHVAKEDREQMTHQVCFEFCRGIPDMGYFGISNGRDCYCESWYKPMASDSSECDSVCEGDNTLMCGGAKKNSIFGMHLCADTEDDISKAVEAGREAEQALARLSGETEERAAAGEALAGSFQKEFGGAGDPVASALMQDAKIWGGKCHDAAADGAKVKDELKGALRDVTGLKGPFTDYKQVKKAEDGIRALSAATARAVEETESLQAFADQLSPPLDDVKDSAKQYFPIMYFVDKKFEDTPQTCGGEQAGKPVMGVDMDTCAASCDALVGKCVGFGFYGRHGDSLCFLYSKFKNAQYYTGCDSGPPPKTPSTKFLQFKGGDVVACQAKLQEFEGLSLKPKGDGKCDICLKEVTKADRCYN